MENEGFLRNKIFVILCFIFLLIFGILIISINLQLIPFIFYGSLRYLILILFIFGQGYVSYLSLGYFGLKKSTMIILMLILSILISVSFFIIHSQIASYYIDLSNKVIAAPAEFANAINIFNVSNILNIYLVILLITLAYLLFPVIDFFMKKEHIHE